MVGKGTLTSWIIPRQTPTAAVPKAGAVTATHGPGGRGSARAHRWSVHKGTLLLKNAGWDSRSVPGVERVKVAAFDFDGTITTTRSGHLYPRGAHDWKFLKFDGDSGDPGCSSMSVVARRLRQLESEGYCIAIMSNQGAIRSAVEGKFAMNVKTKMDEVFDKAIGLSKYVVMCAAQKDVFRKPSTGMFDLIAAILRRATDAPRSTVPSDAAEEAAATPTTTSARVVDMDASFYVGDAAGRDGDHADSDLIFARDVGVSFYTPEEFFNTRSIGDESCSGSDEEEEDDGDADARAQHEKRRRVESGSVASPSWPGAVLPSLPQKAAGVGQASPLFLILVGVQGSGKSTFAKELVRRVASLQGAGVSDDASVLVVNQDSLGSRRKCIQVMQDALAGDSNSVTPACVVLDRMNLEESARAKFIDATRRDATVHCLVFDVPVTVCQQRVIKRTSHRVRGTKFAHLPVEAKAKYEAPRADDGSLVAFVSFLRSAEASDAAADAYARLIAESVQSRSREGE